jgi:hypothetical protein
VLSITEQRRPLFEFLALLDRARIWAARGQVRDALTTIEAARKVVSGASTALLAWADEEEALLRLSLGDLRSPAELAGRLPAVRRSLLRARVALAAGDHHTVRELLRAAPVSDLTPRQALMLQLLLAAAAIERDDPTAAGLLGSALHRARSHGFLNTVVTIAPQVAGTWSSTRTSCGPTRSSSSWSPRRSRCAPPGPPTLRRAGCSPSP